MYHFTATGRIVKFFIFNLYFTYPWQLLYQNISKIWRETARKAVIKWQKVLIFWHKSLNTTEAENYGNAYRACIQHHIIKMVINWHYNIQQRTDKPYSHFVLQLQLWLAAWRSGNGVGRINKVTLRRARLVLGWVTCAGSTPGGGTLFRYVTSQPRPTQPFIHSGSINWVVSNFIGECSRC